MHHYALSNRSVQELFLGRLSVYMLFSLHTNLLVWMRALRPQTERHRESGPGLTTAWSPGETIGNSHAHKYAQTHTHTQIACSLNSTHNHSVCKLTTPQCQWTAQNLLHSAITKDTAARLKTGALHMLLHESQLKIRTEQLISSSTVKGCFTAITEKARPPL